MYGRNSLCCSRLRRAGRWHRGRTWSVVQPRIWHHLYPMGGEGTVGGVRLRWAAGTDVGCVRAVNEDSVLADLPVFVVADGMGGHDAGDVASALVADRFSLLAGLDLPSIRSVTDSITGSNDEIVRLGVESAQVLAMGTTVTGLVLVDNGGGTDWVVFNVGDSRVYRFLDDDLEQLSVDHSFVQELVDAGTITEAEARSHPQRNVVTRALGMESGATADVWIRPPELGERFLVCSDGLTSELDDATIAEALCLDDPDTAVEQLVAAALHAGGRDNVTAVVVDVLDIERDDAADTAPRGVVEVLPRPHETTAEHMISIVPATSGNTSVRSKHTTVPDPATPESGSVDSPGLISSTNIPTVGRDNQAVSDVAEGAE